MIILIIFITILVILTITFERDRRKLSKWTDDMSKNLSKMDDETFIKFKNLYFQSRFSMGSDAIDAFMNECKRRKL